MYSLKRKRASLRRQDDQNRTIQMLSFSSRFCRFWLLMCLLPAIVSCKEPSYNSRTTHQTRTRWIDRWLGAGARMQPSRRTRQIEHPSHLTSFDSDDLNAQISTQNQLSSSKSTTASTRSPRATNAVFSLIWRHRLEISNLMTSITQWTLIAYLGWGIYRAAAELMEEASGAQDYLYVRQQQDVQKAIAFLEQDQSTISKAVETYTSQQGSGNSKKALPVSIGLLQLAQKLMAAGLPLRNPAPASTSQPATPNTQASVESLLSSLSKAEASLLQQCLWIPPISQLHAEGIRRSWDSVVGLDGMKQHLLSTVGNLRKTGKYGKRPHEQAFAPLFDHHSATSGGVLLYGPPGCGKTLLVKTVALRARIPCLVVTPSVLLRKYVGETNLQVRHLFSLAHKLAPCIVCIDELDGLFRERSDSEHEVSRDLKTEFLQWMDGMLSSSNSQQQVLVIGATNRPFDVDSAILRRLSQSLFIGLPDVEARAALLQQSLSRVPTATLDLNHVARRTEGYSPSDLKQLLQAAALYGPMQEARALEPHDMERALTQVPPTPLSPRYRHDLTTFRSTMQGASTTSIDHGKWETGWGNFYDVGTIELDHDTFDSLQYLMDHFPSEDQDDQ